MSAHEHLAFIATANEIAAATSFKLGEPSIEADRDMREATYPFLYMGFFLTIACCDDLWSAYIGYRHVESGERLTTPFYVFGLWSSAVAPALYHQMTTVAELRFGGTTVAEMVAEMDRAMKIPPPPDDEDGGIVFVRPETVARTLDELDEMIAIARVEAEAVANMDGGEWTMRQAMDGLHLAKCLLLQAVHMDDMATIQWMVAQLEEVDS